MSEEVKTVVIVSDNPAHNGRVVINESDYDPQRHTLWEAEQPQKTVRKKRDVSVSA